MDYIENNNIDTKNLNLLISTTPCEKCSKKIMNDNFNFKSIGYLFEKHESNNDNYYKKFQEYMNINQMVLMNQNQSLKLKNIIILQMLKIKEKLKVEMNLNKNNVITFLEVGSHLSIVLKN